MLTTAGHLLFTGNGTNIIAFDPPTENPLALRPDGRPEQRHDHLHARRQNSTC